MGKKKINIIYDRHSWIAKHINIFKKSGEAFQNYKVNIVSSQKKIQKGYALFILSYSKKIKNNILKNNQFNLVVHESNLPFGKGMSPVSNQILENKKKITSCLITASDKYDGGDILYKTFFSINKFDFYEEWRKKQLKASLKLFTKFLSNKKFKFTVQKGKSTFYKKLKKNQFRLDIKKNIISQIQIMKASDFKKFQPFFKIKEKKFYISYDKKK